MKHEFFHDKTGTITDEIYDLAPNDSKKFNEFTDGEVQMLFEHLLKFPEARKALLHLNTIYPTQKRKILSIFIECNWSVLDDIPDITEEKLNYECVPCRHKRDGKCPYKGLGIICIVPELDLFAV